MATRHSPDGELGVAGGDILDYVRHDPALTLVACTPLLSGAYVRDDKPLGPEHDHAGTPVRLEALREVAAETGATPDQVALSWLIGGDVPVTPLVGASSVAQLDESIAAVDLELTAGQRTRLNNAQWATGSRAGPR
jgi:aryl-alcohol dehydrogenase-like predicted oxidoreductase